MEYNEYLNRLHFLFDYLNNKSNLLNEKYVYLLRKLYKNMLDLIEKKEINSWTPVDAMWGMS